VFEQFTTAARVVVTGALEEARLRGDRRIGTEHLLLGLFHQPEPHTVRALGIDLEEARTALRELDLAALAAVGIDARGVERTPTPASRKRTPFSSAAKSALGGALNEARKAGDRRITQAHLALALLQSKEPDPAAELLTHLHVDRAAARTRLRGED
jgi:ATP-dependent Clp protease ATP-binding subunit ClpA